MRVRVRVGAARTQVARRNYPPGARHVHIVVLRLAVTHLVRVRVRVRFGLGYLVRVRVRVPGTRWAPP